MGGIGQVACQGILAWEACVGVLVDKAVSRISSLWSAMKCPAVSFEASMSLVGLLAACILMLRVMFLFC